MAAERAESSEQEQIELLLSLFINPALVPTNPLHRSYLLELYRARKVLMQTGDRTLLHQFPDIYEETDPEIVKTLATQIRIIREQTPYKLPRT